MIKSVKLQPKNLIEKILEFMINTLLKILFIMFMIYILIIWSIAAVGTIIILTFLE